MLVCLLDSSLFLRTGTYPSSFGLTSCSWSCKYIEFFEFVEFVEFVEFIEFFEFIEIFIHHNVYSTDWSSVNLNKYLDGLIRNFLDNLQDKKVKAKLSKKLKPVFESISKNVNQYGEPHLPI